MSIEVKAGSLEDFFASAKETARDIDDGKRLIPKNIIWVEAENLLQLPENEAGFGGERLEFRVEI